MAEDRTKRGQRIAFISIMAGNPWGGSEDLWSKAALRLKERGVDVCASVLDWKEVPEQLEELREVGVRLRFRPKRRSLPGRVLGRLLHPATVGKVDRFEVAWLRRENPDLVVISQGGPWDGIRWMTVCRELGLPYCVVIHANSEIWFPTDPYRDDIVKGMPGARRLYFVSRANMELMNYQCGRKLENAEVIRNPRKVEPSGELPWPDDGELRLACVGRLDPKAKGQDLLLRILDGEKWRGRKIRLTFYGKGPCEGMLRSLVDSLKLENVGFGGFVKDVGGIWKDNHALILPSRYEGLPLVIVEAMLSCRPVITTNVAGNAEYLEDGVTGFVAEAPCVSLVEDAMERAWVRRGDLREMGIAARRHLLEVLPEDPVGVFADKVTVLADEAIAERGKGGGA